MQPTSYLKITMILPRFEVSNILCSILEVKLCNLEGNCMRNSFPQYMDNITFTTIFGDWGAVEHDVSSSHLFPSLRTFLFLFESPSPLLFLSFAS